MTIYYVLHPMWMRVIVDRFHAYPRCSSGISPFQPSSVSEEDRVLIILAVMHKSSIQMRHLNLLRRQQSPRREP
jgi:hypothetical protein